MGGDSVIPAGMVPWAGKTANDGLEAGPCPTDYNGGYVLYRSGIIGPTDNDWSHGEGPNDIIAYTPRTPKPSSAGERRDSLEAIIRDPVQMAVTAGYISATQGDILARSIADAILATNTRDERLREALPLIKAIAEWEEKNGTAAVILPEEYEPFCRMIMKAAVTGSTRAALTKEASDAG